MGMIGWSVFVQEDVIDMKKKEAANEKLMYDIAQENKRLTEPLTRALKEVESLRKQLAAYDKVDNVLYDPLLEQISLFIARVYILSSPKN